ncbi:MAG: methyltransferase domain-containing protein [Anaerolineales bacterium]|nr:methyltransferase domain-containing protein [Anaerolineales bacterium]
MSVSASGMEPDIIRRAVAQKYGQVALHPQGPHPFPVGYDFALSLGYAPQTLDSLPRRAVASFAGISNPLAHADLLPGETVLDLGCGAGLDTLLIARQIGPQGVVHSLDLSTDMLAIARMSAAEAGLENIIFHQAPAEAVPLETACVDVVIINGIFNLCPDKKAVMGEVFRLLHPGGRVLVSEIVIQAPEGDQPEGAACDPNADRQDFSLDNWFR